MRQWIMMGLWCVAAMLNAQNSFYRINEEIIDTVIQQYVPDSLGNKVKKEIKKGVLSLKVDEADEKTIQKIKDKRTEKEQKQLQLDSLTQKYNQRNNDELLDEGERERLEESLRQKEERIATLEQQISQISNDWAWVQQNANNVKNSPIVMDTDMGETLADLLEQAKLQMAGVYNEEKNNDLASRLEELRNKTPRNGIPQECGSIINALKNQKKYYDALETIKAWIMTGAIDNKTVKKSIGEKISRKLTRDHLNDPFPAYYEKMSDVLKKYRSLNTGDEIPDDEF